MIGINVPIPVPMAYYSFGGWKASLFGDTHAHGLDGVHFFTRQKAITTRWLDPSARRPQPRLPHQLSFQEFHDDNHIEQPAHRRGPRHRDRARAARLRAGPQARLPLVVGAGTDQADDGARRQGLLPMGRRRQQAARLLLTAGEHQHRPSAPESRCRHCRTGREAVHHRAAARQRRALGGRPVGRRAHPGRPEPHLLHQRRRRRRRACGADGPAAHRPVQGALAVPLVSRRHRHRDQPDR